MAFPTARLHLQSSIEFNGFQYHLPQSLMKCRLQSFSTGKMGKVQRVSP
jgi:hypothetical protein